MGQSRFRSLLEAEASGIGLSLDARCLDRLDAHYRLLVKWNRAVRLVGDVDPGVVVRRHVMESLRLLPFIHETRGALLDIGSGNGYPAIPLKCALPDLRVVMLEPTVRKSIFLSYVIDELELADARVIRERVDHSRDLARLGRWDCITMRAVSAIPAIMDGGPGALRAEGRIILMLGESGRADALRRISAPLSLVAEERVPHTERSFIVVLSRAGAADDSALH